MKKLIILSVLVVLVFADCGRKKHSVKKTQEERIEIVPFYRNRVMIQDLHQIDTNKYLVEPEEFLNKSQYETFKTAMWSIIRNPKAKVYSGPNDTYSTDVLKDKVSKCDSVMESSFDAEGNEIVTTRFMCDSTSIMDNLSLVYFFESWYLNAKTNLIEKETLGFVLWNYVKQKEAYREIFIVFRDEEARQKCKKYYFAD